MLFIPLAMALCAVDLEFKRLPDAMTLSATGIALALIGAVALAAFYFLLNLVSRGGMGMGDVKSALSIGALTGYFGWVYTVGATFMAFLVGSIVSIGLMLLGRATRKSSVPSGTFMHAAWQVRRAADCRFHPGRSRILLAALLLGPEGSDPQPTRPKPFPARLTPDMISTPH